MKSPWKVIAQLEADASRLAKEAIIRQEMLAGNTELFEGVRLALDCLVTFGVKQVPERTGTDGAGLSWDVFSLAITGLVNRDITGNAARDMIAQLMAAATTEQWNSWYRRILIKDLKCGVSDKTLNSVAKKLKLDEYAVPVFACQLAFDSANHEGKMLGRKLIGVKMDGCLSEDWVIEFENGKKLTIKEVVDNKIKGKVKSFDTITGKIEFNEITGWAKDGIDDAVEEYDWFKITLNDGTELPPLTGNHLIYLPKLKCYRRADLLTAGDEVLVDI